MQPPQETGFDWWHAAFGLGGGALGTFLTWFWRAARIEPTIRADFEKGTTAIGKMVEEKMDLEIKAFDETLRGLREKINGVELHTARNFVAKPDFEDFRTEYREDKNRMFQKLDSLLSRK